MAELSRLAGAQPIVREPRDFESGGRGYTLTGSGEPEQVSGLRVTASFFTVLGVQPMLGRTFLPAEETPGSDRVVVLSHGLWTRRYGADRSIVGRTIQIDDEARTVVGVMPVSFVFQFWSAPRELWVPPSWTQGDADRGSNSFVCIGRLKRGVSVVGFVLLIACVNVANLMLARAAARHRELAIRCALGAGRGRITRQLLTESVMLGAAGGAAGLVLAFIATKALLPVLPASLTGIALRPLVSIDVDVKVLLFTTAVSVLSGVLFGLAPAIAVFRNHLNDALKEQARGSTSGRSRLRYGLAASEVALTLVVLAGAGVMIVSVARLLNVDPGLDPRNVMVMSLTLPQENLYYGPSKTRCHHRRWC